MTTILLVVIITFIFLLVRAAIENTGQPENANGKTSEGSYNRSRFFSAYHGKGFTTTCHYCDHKAESTDDNNNQETACRNCGKKLVRTSTFPNYQCVWFSGTGRPLLSVMDWWFRA